MKRSFRHLLRRLGSSYRIEVLPGSEVLRKIDLESRTRVPYMYRDDYVDLGFSPRVFEGRNLYVIVWDGPKVVAARKIYKDLPGQKDHLNKWLEVEGLPLVRGHLYVSAYIGVDPEYRRQGLGLRMHDVVAEMMKPGDVLQFGSHEPQGAQLTSAWIRRHPEFNIIFSEGGRYPAYSRYDPSKKNFVIKDRSSYKDVFGG